jgi:DmsE family decaheme c-type cytochrome
VPRFTTQRRDAGLVLPDDTNLKLITQYVRLAGTVKVATGIEQRILRAHERRGLRAQRAARQPDYVAQMPEARDDGLVTTWVALDQLDDSADQTPRFDFVQILAARSEDRKPILIAAQKQPKSAVGARAPMVAPAPNDPEGRYFVGSKPCETCHAGLFDEFGETLMGRGIKSGKITTQGKMECETCHGPGSGHVNGGGGREKGGIRSFRLNDARGVDVEDYNGICLNCHEKGEQTYWRASVHESRGVACVNCHTVMRKVKTRFQIKYPTVSETCFQCHKDREAQAQRTAHMPLRENKITCASCHNPHGSASDKMIREATVNDTCYTCHADKRGPFLFEHAPVRENCLNCHEPHGSMNESLLIVARERLCQECHPAGHSQPGLPASTNTNATRYAAGNSCQNCHTNIHGSNSPSGGRWHR